jgi:hypothetical protein
MTHPIARLRIPLVAIAALALSGCGLVKVHPDPAASLRVEVAVSAEGFEWATPEDQAQCAKAEAYPSEVAAVLDEALQDDCALCRLRSLSFRLFLLNDPVGQRATVVSLVLLSPGPDESAPALEALSGALSHTTLPPLPLRRPRCSLDVSVSPSDRP